ncbi:MAG: SRPBCC family protein [Acidimicrobiales bacterium]
MREQATERMVMHASPQACFDTIVDFERYAEWAADVKSVEVAARDEEGRGTQVTFRVAAFGRSTTYALAYDYSGAPSQVSWVQTNGDVTSRLEGRYVLEAADDGDTEVVYHLDVELKVPIPGFVKRRAEGRIIHTALGDLRERVEGRNVPSPPPRLD